jgi:CRP-like cAMP-binding protein
MLNLEPESRLTVNEHLAMICDKFLLREELASRARARVHEAPVTRSAGSTMTTLDQARAIVARQGWLSYVPAPYRQTVLERSQLEEFRAGATIYSMGDPPGGMYGLVAGKLAISIAPGERAPYITHFGQPGTWFGDAAAFTEQPRRVGLAVTRAAEVLHLPLHAIREIVATDPGAWRWFGLALVANLDTAIGGSDDLMIRDHVKRFVAVLLRLGGCRYSTPPGGTTIEIHVNQEDLAAMTIMARTTAGALLHKLQTAGHVDAGYRSIRIIAPDALREMLAD